MLALIGKEMEEEGVEAERVEAERVEAEVREDAGGQIVPEAESKKMMQSVRIGTVPVKAHRCLTQPPFSDICPSTLSIKFREINSSASSGSITTVSF